MTFVWDHPPRLSTHRLHLRALTPADRHDLFGIYGDPVVMQHASDPPFPDVTFVDQTLTSVAALFQQQQSIEWGMTMHTDDHVIGTCGIHSFTDQRNAAEIGCLLQQAYWGQSLMREALEVVIQFGFTELQLDMLHADIDAPNTRSIRLFQRLGFCQEHPDSTIYTLKKPPSL